VLGVELGYARVSTAKQDLDRQVDALTTVGILFRSNAPSDQRR